ncbi:MAG TPA: response regulator [Pirellulales bacterium]|jgi:DNA-binding response OmpR family regulator|nr:response regulator [Pirellulales bacterium]
MTAKNPLRVLIVDDNHDQADSLAVLLQLRGYESKVAYCAKTARDLAAAFQPDALIVDLNMPQINGYDLVGQLRGQLTQATFIAATGMVGEAYRQKALEAGFAHYFVKPINVAKLRETLEGIKAAQDSPA